MAGAPVLTSAGRSHSSGALSSGAGLNPRSRECLHECVVIYSHVADRIVAQGHDVARQLIIGCPQVDQGAPGIRGDLLSISTEFVEPCLNLSSLLLIHIAPVEDDSLEWP